SGRGTVRANGTYFKSSEWRVWNRVPSLRFQSRDLPDLVELSQKLQARLSEAFKNTHLGQMSERAYLSPGTTRRLSQYSNASVRRVYSSRSQTHRSVCSLQTSPATHSPNEGFEYLGGCNMYALALARANPHGSSRTHSPTLLRKRIHLRKSVIGSGSEVGGPDSCATKKNLSTPSPPTDVHQAASLEMPEGISMKMVEDIVLFPPFKSSRSFGFRYYKGRLLQTAAEPKKVTGEIPPHVSIPALRSNISGSIRAKTPSDGNPDAAVKPLSGNSEGSNPSAVIGLVSKSSKPSVGWTYLFEEAMLNSTESKLWSNMQFWEDMFLDTVTQEREILGKYAIMNREIPCAFQSFLRLSLGIEQVSTGRFRPHSVQSV
ncbi:unnamed protein product, partial [Dibothriocephalus latus]